MTSTGTMSSRERLRRCYYHEQTDRPGVYCRTYFPKEDPTYEGLRKLLEQHADRKAQWGPWGLVGKSHTESHREPHTEDYERLVTILRTPKGELRSTRLVSLRGLPGLDETHFLKSREDAEAYLSQPIPGIAGSVHSFFEMDRAIGDRGIVSVSPGQSPGGHVAKLFGSEAFAMMSITDRDILHALCEREAAITMEHTKFLLENGVGPYFQFAGEEYLVPPLHGARDFRDFIVRYEKPIFDLIHDGGGRVHVHSHGKIRAVMDAFVEMGADVLHPFEAPPSGDITAAEAKAKARGRMTLEGNIQIADLYDQPVDELVAQTEQLIEECFDDRRGLIVCPTASPFIRDRGLDCLERYRAMVDTVLAVG